MTTETNYPTTENAASARAHRWQLAEILLVIVAAVLPRIFTLGGTFVVHDETLYWSWTNDFWQAIFDGRWADTLVGAAYPSVLVFWVQAAGLSAHWLWSWLSGALSPNFAAQIGLTGPLDFALLGQRRLAMALANALAIVLVYLSGRKLLGRPVALVGALLIALDPFLLSDGRTMRGDALMAGLMLLAALNLLLAGTRQQWRWLVYSAVAAGLALLVKMSALPLVLWGGLVMAGWGLAQLIGPLAQTGRRWSALWRQMLLPAAVWLALIALTFVALWPAMWVTPGTVLATMFGRASALIDGRTTYFMGRTAEAELLPLFYPVTLFLRTTPITLIGVLLLIIAAGVWIWRWRRGVSALSPRVVHLLLIGAYLLTFLVVMTYGLIKRDWYLLPMVPPLLLLAAQGWVWGWNRLRSRWGAAVRRPVWSTLSKLAVSGLLLILVLQAGGQHPYFYGYWTPLLPKASIPYLLELSWGIDTSLPALWLNNLPDSENLTVAMRPSLREIRPMFDGDMVTFANQQPWAQADYIIIRHRHLQLNEHQPEQLAYLQHFSPVYTATLNGVSVGWVYPGPAATIGLYSDLTGQAVLLGYDAPTTPLRADQAAPMRVIWQTQPLWQAASEELFARLVDNDGFVWLDRPFTPSPAFAADAAQSERIIIGQFDLTPPVGMPPGLYFLKLGIRNTETGQLVGEFELPAGQDQIQVESATPPTPSLPVTHTTNTPLGDDLLLLGYSLPNNLPANQPVEIYWQARQNITADYVIALRLLDAAGQEVWYQLSRPARGIYPTPGWRANEIVRDPWQPANLEHVLPGNYTLQLEVYHSDKSVGKINLGEVNVTATAP